MGIWDLHLGLAITVLVQILSSEYIYIYKLTVVIRVLPHKQLEAISVSLQSGDSWLGYFWGTQVEVF